MCTSLLYECNSKTYSTWLLIIFPKICNKSINVSKYKGGGIKVITTSYDFKLIVLFMHGFVMQYHANCNSYYFSNKWVENRREKGFPLIFLNYLYAKIFFLFAYTHINSENVCNFSVATTAT